MIDKILSDSFVIFAYLLCLVLLSGIVELRVAVCSCLQKQNQMSHWSNPCGSYRKMATWTEIIEINCWPVSLLNMDQNYPFLVASVALDCEAI